MLITTKTSYLLVVIQFACLLYFALTGFICKSLILLVLEVSAVLLGAWAIVVMRFSNLTVMPEPKSTSKLLKRGPYAIIRHPMYTSILLICLCLLIDQFSFLRLAVFLLLVVNQVIKLNYEESLLLQQFDDYKNYRKSTWKIIPFVY